MIKIFIYEFRIILCKIYVPVMMVAGLAYSWYLLSTETILGVSDTAPFSGWSFGKYLGDTTLISMLITLLIIAMSFSERQRRAGILTDVTAFPPKKRILVRGILTGGFFLLCTLLNLLMGCIFLGNLFGEIYLGSYLLDWVLICLPCALLLTGMGMLLGRISPVLVYVFMALCLLTAFLFTGPGIDINGASYFVSMPDKLAGLECIETPFVISAGYILTRCVYLLLGLGAYIVIDRRSGRIRRKDPG